MQQVVRNETSGKEVWVISRTEDRFRVYSPARPTISYFVTDIPNNPACSCRDFQEQEFREEEPPWLCAHIKAVLSQFQQTGQYLNATDRDEVEEGRAIQEEGQSRTPLGEVGNAYGSPSQMLIKRSVSPDGRIDSLSVEFNHSVDRESARQIKDKAVNTLRLQSDIVSAFLLKGKSHNGNGSTTNEPDPDGAVSAVMLDVAGMNGKWGGRRLFINVSCNGHSLKLFGTRQQLSASLTDAGFWNMAEQIKEGTQLNLPCRIITKPSADGRFLNIDQVLPAESPRARRRAGP